MTDPKELFVLVFCGVFAGVVFAAMLIYGIASLHRSEQAGETKRALGWICFVTPALMFLIGMWAVVD